MKKGIRAVVGPLIVLAMLIGSLWLLRHELRQYQLRDFLQSLADIPARKLWTAAVLTGLNFVVLNGYDLLGLRYIHQAMSPRRVALVSFLGCAVGHNFGTLLGGSTIRYRLYSAWGLSAVDIVKLVLIQSGTFWIGLCALAGVVFLVDPLPIPPRLHLPVDTTMPLGVVLCLVAISYLAICAARRAPLTIWKWQFLPPSVGLCLWQYVVATLDLMLAAAVLYVLMPASLETGYLHFLAIYLLALSAALLTQVPGGLGVMELMILLLLSPREPQLVFGSLLAYRLIYYLIPLSAGLLLLGGNEIALNRTRAGKAVASVSRWTRFVAPRLLACTVFAAGVILLISGATPAEHGRLQLLRRLLPLPVVELSHFLGSLAGVLLILLARAIQRRIETAYYVTSGLLIGGILFSLLKGFDYEEALILGATLAVFLTSRAHFHRKGALLTDRFSAGWFVAIAMVLACTVWLMLFAYSHVGYSDELWWRFEFGGNVPRSLRATAGVVLVVLLFTSARLLRSKPREPEVPTAQDLDAVREIVVQSPRISAQLALLGDKRFLFNENRTAFIMYGIEGRSWVSMGDPVGDEQAVRDLAWDFHELCDEGGRWPVFYRVDEVRVPMYVEMGLTLIKLGEEARVPLSEFGLEGAVRRNLRRTHRQLTEAGCSFEIVEPPLDDGLLATLKDVSDAWLNEKNAAEKSFSVGSFQLDYIRGCPVALVRHAGEIVGLANVWRGAGSEELTVDLMRYSSAAPHSVMEFLFIKLMLWGREHGYRWFNLGMAPLAGLPDEPLGPVWNRLASLAFRHGEHFYNFQGLRQYKDKFDPVWRPKYLASPGGFRLPLILTNVATLISGGLVELIKK